MEPNNILMSRAAVVVEKSEVGERKSYRKADRKADDLLEKKN